MQAQSIGAIRQAPGAAYAVEPRQTMMPLSHQRWIHVLLLLLVVVAIVSRIYGIGKWSLIGDEYYTVTYAAERANSLINPAYYNLVLWSTGLFGESAWAARLPSVLFGIFSVPLIFLVGRSLFNSTTGLVSALFFVVSEWSLYYAQISRFYSGLLFFGLLAYWLFYLSLQRDSLKLYVLSLASVLCGFLFQVTAVAIPVAMGAIAAVTVSKRDSTFSRKVARAHLVACLVGVIAVAPVVLHVWQERTGGVVLTLANVVSLYAQLARTLDSGIIIASLFGLVVVSRSASDKGIFLLASILIPLAMFSVAATLVPPVRDRYFIYIFPFILIMSAVAAVYVAERLHDCGIGQHVVTAVLCASLFVGFVSYYTGRVSLDVRDVVAELDARYEHGHTIIAFSDGWKAHLTDRFREDDVVVVGGKAIWSSVLRPRAAGQGISWVIIDTYRNPIMNAGLKEWLLNNAQLVWRGYERRYDYRFFGYEIYRIGSLDAVNGDGTIE